MKERPILFSAPMVQALLDGRKTQTRRIVKSPGVNSRICPYGKPGDRLWVREAHYLTDNGDSEYAVYAADGDAVRAHLTAIAELPGGFPEGVKERHRKLRPSIHMPRWASRILLEVTDVRVERLQDITPRDAMAEGVEGKGAMKDVVPNNGWRMSYRDLWESINGAGSWGKNPWVWVVEFKRIES